MLFKHSDSKLVHSVKEELIDRGMSFGAQYCLNKSQLPGNCGSLDGAGYVFVTFSRVLAKQMKTRKSIVVH